jgi:uncharacterized protein YdeI (YjbR/CyaY-like superfamily)
MEEWQTVEVYSEKDFRDWLIMNHENESGVIVVIHKKHTGKMKTNTAALMREAICFGWIDTTARRLDEDRYIVNYRKRTKNSRWSRNTLRYGKELIKEGRMMPQGLKFYKEGLKKLPHDYGIDDNPEAPLDFVKALEKSKKSKENFEKLAPSYKKTYLRWILKAKMPETRKRRINISIKMINEGRNGFITA